jgi:hypothetical protein
LNLEELTVEQQEALREERLEIEGLEIDRVREVEESEKVEKMVELAWCLMRLVRQASFQDSRTQHARNTLIDCTNKVSRIFWQSLSICGSASFKHGRIQVYLHFGCQDLDADVKYLTQW